LAELASLFRYWQSHPIASRDLAGTVARFLRWQLGSRLLRMPLIVPWVGRTSLVIETGMTTPMLRDERKAGDKAKRELAVSLEREKSLDTNRYEVGEDERG
jgi:hypothetical protein